jgi:hypothetical protein
MSTELIARSPDLKRLRDNGYAVEARCGFLIVRSVPYVTPTVTLARGVLVTDLALNEDVTQTPKDHQVWFLGEQPCNVDGSPIAALGAQTCVQTLADDVAVNYRFSAKRPEGYSDYYAKITQYVEILSHPARALAVGDATVSAQTFAPIETREEESVFLYTDSASSRAGIAHATEKFVGKRIAIVGMGGTGSYVLDQAAKTPVAEIHLFDGDDFLQHNAFRAPGAASLDDLRAKRSKVQYYADLYGKMRRGIIPHPVFIDAATVEQLAGFDFVFVSVDRAVARKLISDFMHVHGIPFIDAGMELELIDEQACLVGTCRVTLSTPDKHDHFTRHVSLGGDAADDLYATNVQVADMNGLNAMLAVIKWKKFCGFYQDCYREHQSVYVINAHQLTRDEMVGA